MQNTRNSAFAMSKSEAIYTGGSYIAPVIVASSSCTEISSVSGTYKHRLSPAFLLYFGNVWK